MASATVTVRASRVPIYYEILELLSGLGLALFMWAHLIFVATIILGKGTFDGIAVFLEDYYLAHVGIPAIIVLFFVHVVMTGRKIPFQVREQRVIIQHARLIKHFDTWTWLFQVVSGMIILAMGSIHFWVVNAAWPIRAEASIDRVGQNSYLIFYIILLLLVEMHASIGLFRLGVKWGVIPRRHAHLIFNILTIVVLFIGGCALVFFRRLGG